MNVERAARSVKIALIVTACLVPPLYVAAFFEAANEGPWTRAHNHRLNARAAAVRLVGRPERDVEPMLGRASEITSYGPGSTTFNYYPWPGMPISQFQVHTKGGVVTGLELFD